MKTYDLGSGENFLVYDETKEYDETPEFMKRCSHLPPKVIDGALKIYLASGKATLEEAYGHPQICYFNILEDGSINFQFCNERNYTDSELKEILKLAYEKI